MRCVLLKIDGVSSSARESRRATVATGKDTADSSSSSSPIPPAGGGGACGGNVKVETGKASSDCKYQEALLKDNRVPATVSELLAQKTADDGLGSTPAQVASSFRRASCALSNVKLQIVRPWRLALDLHSKQWFCLSILSGTERRRRGPERALSHGRQWWRR